MEQLPLFDEQFRHITSGHVKFLQVNEKETADPIDSQSWKTDVNSLSCLYCRVEFDNITELREHHKLDWHRYNIKQKLLSKSPLKEEEFNAKADDVSSISGSSSEDEDEGFEGVAASQGKVYLQNEDGKVFSIYRNLLLQKKADIEEHNVSHLFHKCLKNSQWVLLMIGGGHFAGAVYQNNTPVLHKTFHLYTVRGGHNGGAQSTRDNRGGGGAKSAGSSLRRYNEVQLTLRIRNTLEAWKKEISASSLIFYRASGTQNQNILFGGKEPIFSRSDTRLRNIPFSTRRATFTELKRVYTCLTSISLYDSIEAVLSKFSKENGETNNRQKKPSNINRCKSRESVNRSLPTTPFSSSSSSTDECEVPNISYLSIDECEVPNVSDLSSKFEEIKLKDTLESFGDSLTAEQRKRVKKRKKKSSKTQTRLTKEREMKWKEELYSIVKSGDLQKLIIMKDKFENEMNAEHDNIKKKDTEDANNVYIKKDVFKEKLDNQGNTILHLAAFYQYSDMVEHLLENGADPCFKNDKQQTAYCCTQNNEIRKTFKDFAQSNPDKYNYNKAQIPLNTLSLEEQLEKKKLQKQIKREKEKEKKKNNYVKQQEESEKQRFLNLSDREKRALAAERRILNQSGTVTSRCFLCASDMAGKVPFEYSGNRFCTIDCLKAHRMKTVTLLK